MDELCTGLIVKATGGFYYLAPDGAPEGETLECRARGLFRKQKITPLTGDRARAELTGNGSGYLLEMLPRRNELIRPPLANLDRFVVVASVVDPAPNLLVIDQMLAIACHKGIRPMLVVTKRDLADTRSLEEIYRLAGIQTFSMSIESEEDLAELRAELAVGVSAFTGNSGVGKSSLLNRLDQSRAIETGETSRKLGRGRHTTRHVELYPTGAGGYIADTPGFSVVETERYERIRKEELENCFPEFEAYLGKCKYVSCTHTVEKGCAVLEALHDGCIALSRHESYRAMHEQARQVKDWERRE